MLSAGKGRFADDQGKETGESPAAGELFRLVAIEFNIN